MQTFDDRLELIILQNQLLDLVWAQTLRRGLRLSQVQRGLFFFLRSDDWRRPSFACRRGRVVHFCKELLLLQNSWLRRPSCVSLLRARIGLDRRWLLFPKVYYFYSSVATHVVLLGLLLSRLVLAWSCNLWCLVRCIVVIDCTILPLLPLLSDKVLLGALITQFTRMPTLLTISRGCPLLVLLN